MNNIRKEYMPWPGAEEGRELAKWVENAFHIPNCPLMMDGTLLCLGIEPECKDAADYRSQ